jgi:hypothetical protein
VGFLLKQVLHRFADEGIAGQFSAFRQALERCPDFAVEIDVEIHLRSPSLPNITAHRLYQAEIQRTGGNLTLILIVFTSPPRSVFLRNDGNTALYAELLAAGALPDTRDDEGWVPLQFAAHAQSESVTSL